MKENKRGDKVKKRQLFLMTVIFFCSSILLAQEVRIQKMSGDVKVRYGMDEGWNSAASGMVLRDIDTILTGEDGEVVLSIHDGLTFKLGRNTMIDIADLRLVTERELFLFLMRKKMKKIGDRGKRVRLHSTPNTSVIHGTDMVGNKMQKKTVTVSEDLPEPLKNGIRALYDHSYFPNTVMKLYGVLEKSENADVCGEMHYLLGSSLEKLGKDGQAADAYENVLSSAEGNSCDGNNWLDEAKEGLARVSEKE